MHIYCLGINHSSAPISLLEQLALGEEGTRLALARVSHANRLAALTELVILSTCNRIELYAAAPHVAFRELEAFLSSVSGMRATDFRAHAYQATDIDAARHLHEVASGLDSLVVGEPQILGQVTRALELAREQNVAGPIMNQLFQAAIHTGKRVRSETEIGRHPVSVSSLAASLATHALRPPAEAHVLVLGAGEMAELAVSALRKRRITHITVVNRTIENARALADRWQAQAATYEHLDRLLEATDIVISSTSAPHFIVSASMVEQAMQHRPQRPMVLIDIAVPRDIDPAASLIPNVQVHDMESLHGQVEHSRLQRLAEVPAVQRILEEELARFARYLESLAVRPLIAGIRQQAEALRQAELERTLRHLPNLTKAERERLDLMTRALMKKFLETPTQRLQAEAASPLGPEYAAMVRSLFGLESPATDQGLPDADWPIISTRGD